MKVSVYVQDIGAEIREHRSWYIFEGVLFLVMGLLAILLPSVTAMAATLLLGAVLFVGGVTQTATFFRYPKRWWKLFSGLLFVAGGLLVAFAPLAGLLTLAILIGTILLLEGFFEIMFALSFKPFPEWKWMMFSGVMSLILSAFVFVGFPSTTVLFLTIVIGINLGAYGMSILLLALKAGKEPSE